MLRPLLLLSALPLLLAAPCTQDEECSPHTRCCFDLSIVALAKESDLEKVCCDEDNGVIVPRGNLTQKQLQQLDFKINYLSAYYLDSVVCESLEYQAMLEVGSCLQFTTTTPDPVQLHHTDAAAATVTNIFIKVFTTLLAIAKLAH